MNAVNRFFLFFILISSAYNSGAQEAVRADSIPGKIEAAIITDTGAKKINYPRNAAIRSAILPGLGQAYNKKYWKIPIVYAALGITGYIFFDNIGVYKESKQAYSVRLAAIPTTAIPKPDSTAYNALKSIYRIASPESIRNQRDNFRRYIDYSALFFIVFWGLNVVDAAVDAHLRDFDISPDLSMKIKPAYNPVINTAGISFVFTIGKNKSSQKLITLK